MVKKNEKKILWKNHVKYISDSNSCFYEHASSKR